MNKGAIKNFATEARKKLISTVENKMGMLGITKNECTLPVQKGEGYEVYKTTAETENTIYGNEIFCRQSLVDEIKNKGYENIVEEVAYTWFNRIIAIRFMEINNYLPTRVRVLSSDIEGKIEPDILNEAPDIDLDFTEVDIEFIINAKAENELDKLFRFLFIKQCNKLGEILPELFEKTKDYTEMLLNISYIDKDDVIRMLVDGVPEEDFDNEVEILGWMYQYYISEKHNEVVNVLKGKSIKKDDIPAATQLFTTDWVVRYMVDNSLGKYWIERNPSSTLSNELEFYIKPKSGEKFINEDINLEELTFIDNCMGSGHILVYAFDVFMKIYKECGYSEKDAAIKIVENNLFGLDIDKRAYQLSYFAIMMKARSYNRRIFSKGIKPNLCEIVESNDLDIDKIKEIGFSKDSYEKIDYLIKQYIDAKEFGSLITIKMDDYNKILLEINDIKEKSKEDLYLASWINEDASKLEKIIKQAIIMSNKYTIIATNPPYLNKFDVKLKKFLNDNYKDYSGDLFSVFMYKNFDYLKKYGYSAFMTPNVWMFIKSYEKLRKYIIDNKNIVSLIQMAKGAFFKEATVDVVTFVMSSNKNNHKGQYIRLEEFKGDMDVQKKKTLEAINNDNCKYLFECNKENFNKIPGSPIAYWVNQKVLSDFDNQTINLYGQAKVGIGSGNTNYFLKLWFEVNNKEIDLNADYSKIERLHFVPINKGGAYRKWFGNQEYVINWENNGYELKNYCDDNGKKLSYPRNLEFQMMESLTWGDITSGDFSMRYSPKGFFFSDVGNSLFLYDANNTKYILAFCNTKVFNSLSKIINTTIHFKPGNMLQMPIVINTNYKGYINKIVNVNISLSKNDWDSFETSWNFIKHPLITYKTSDNNTDTSINKCNYKIEDVFNAWKENAEKNFYKLKENEEELNRIFIDIYGLQDELTPEEEDKDVTIRKADRERDIKSFISYAVGCMFGRYSLDAEGLIYAGGNFNDKWDLENKKVRSIKKDEDGNIVSDTWVHATFLPEKDNIIPITEEEYLENDIVSRFVEFVKTVYGEDTLEENLKFIADSLNNKGNSSREVIRNYFLKDFYKDHVKIYKKRPIYWLFDSGKENGFKALIYMHRYNEDTVGKVRTEYLHKIQGSIENSILRAEHIIENSDNAREKAKATKEKNKYIKQLKETRIYDEAMSYKANERIKIDLDDGVKVNYTKFQEIEIAKEGKKTEKINLLAKI